MSNSTEKTVKVRSRLSYPVRMNAAGNRISIEARGVFDMPASVYEREYSKNKNFELVEPEKAKPKTKTTKGAES